MTKNDLITKQQLRIEILEKRLSWSLADKREIALQITCVGGPLNDNFLQYTNPQLGVFSSILEIAEREDHELIEAE